MIYSRPQRVIHKHMHISVVFLLFCFYVKKGRFLGLNAGFHLGFTKLPTKLILILLLVNLSTYRVLIKYFFFQEFLIVCHLSLASTRLLLVVQKITSQ